MGRRDERDVIVIEPERGGGAAWWLLVGASLGAGLALLFAPRSGAETRRQLARRLTRLKGQAEEAFEELKEEVSDALAGDEAHPGSVSDAEEASGPEGDLPARGGREAAPTARQELERRLADARARRHRALAADEDEEPVA